MRALLGGIAGLIAGVAIVAGLSSFASVQDYWPVLVVGVVAGLIMKAMAAGPNASYFRGALAALATVAAMIGGQMAAAKVIQSKSASISPDALKNISVADDDGDSDEAAEPAAAPVIEEPIVTGEPMPAVAVNKVQQGDIKPIDIGFLVGGCLLAYQLGKGAKHDPNSEPPAEEAPAENQADSGEAPAEEA